MQLNALVQAVEVTDDREGAAERLCAEATGLSVADALTTPFLPLGTAEEIADPLLARRPRWGISYYVVRDVDSFAPVIDRLRSADAVDR